MKNRTIVTIVLYTLFLASCAPMLELVKRDDLSVPRAFPGQHPSASPSTIKSWQDFFPDNQLRAMIQEALKNNQELHVIEQEIQIANNEVTARQGEYLPKLGLGAEGGIEKVGENTSQGASDAANGVPERLKVAKVGLVGTWEVDIWNKLRNASKAAFYHYLSTIEGQRFLVTRTVSEIAHTYFELMALDNQVRIINSYVDILKKITYMVERQKSAARVTSLPVRRFEAEVLKNEAKQVELRQQIVVTQNRLNSLIGRFPEKLHRNSDQFMNLKMAGIDAGIPSSLLENRPDVKAASLEVESAKLNLLSAKAQFYPSLTIDASTGFESFNTQHFVTPGSVFYNAIGGLTAPLLNRNAIKASYFSANNRQIQAVYRYEQTLVKAFAEVVNQMNMIKNFDEVLDLKSRQVAAMEDAAKTSNVLFQAARVDYVESLLTQRDSLDAQIELVEIKKQQLGAYVDLYQAVGGGWKGTDSYSTQIQ
jgi:outer membrane protein, multidrug efflux system